MRTLRYWFRLSVAFITRFKLLLFFGVLTGFLVFVVLRFFLPRMTQGTTERIGITGRFHTEELPYEVTSLVGQGLTQTNEKGQVEGALAESWQSNDQGTEWTFHLKDGVFWHDGTEVNATTINYSFEDVIIEKPDNKTLVFKLQSPFSPFPSVLAKPVFKKGFIGTADWQVKNISLAGEYVESTTLIAKNGDKKIFYFYPTEDLAKLAFKLGKVDRLEDLLDPAEFKKWGTVEIAKEPNSSRYVAVFFNNESAPFDGNKEMRQALSYAIDKEKLSTNRATGPISPYSWAFNPQVKKYDYDREHALAILKDLSQEVINNTNIKLVTTPVLLEVAETIEKDWEAIGIKTTVQVTSVIPSDFQAFLAIYDIPKDPDQYAIWHSTQIGNTNISKFDNPRIDKLLEDGRLKLSLEERKKIYLDFQRFLLEEAPAIFLYHPLSYTIIRK